ncbi:MAG: hypothetical protein OQK98_00865 [Gammaproteobacteria bacterium]|nr:hypothetical protein [Gammaproteobacteria bacterium]
MSFSLQQLAMPTHDTDKHDNLSSVLLTPSQHITDNIESSEADEDCDISLHATFNNDGAVASIMINHE